MRADLDLADLPGSLHVLAGVRDLEARRATPAALLASIAAQRLGELGLAMPAWRPAAEPELALYAALRSESDPYFRYVSLLRELDSFLDALEARRARARA